MFGVVPKVIWNTLNPADEKNLCTWAMRCLLVKEGNRLILIDTGMGNKQSDRFFSYYEPHGDATLEGSLRKHGFSPDDITDVFLTHLHFDHCGAAIRYDAEHKLIPAFKNATYWSHAAHWEWAVKPNAREKASFLKENIIPIEESGQLRFYQEGEELIPGFTAQVVHGHTEAMMVPVIEVHGQKLAYMADLLPSAAHLPLAYVMAYDIRPLDSLLEKEHFLKKAVAENYILYFEHDPRLEACTLQQTERGIRMKESIRVAGGKLIG